METFAHCGGATFMAIMNSISTEYSLTDLSGRRNGVFRWPVGHLRPEWPARKLGDSSTQQIRLARGSLHGGLTVRILVGSSAPSSSPCPPWSLQQPIQGSTLEESVRRLASARLLPSCYQGGDNDTLSERFSKERKPSR